MRKRLAGIIAQVRDGATIKKTVRMHLPLRCNDPHCRIGIRLLDNTLAQKPSGEKIALLRFQNEDSGAGGVTLVIGVGSMKSVGGRAG
jgi:hypothetical protein